MGPIHALTADDGLKRVDELLTRFTFENLEDFVLPAQDGARYELGNEKRSVTNTAALLKAFETGFDSRSAAKLTGPWSVYLKEQAAIIATDLAGAETRTRDKAAYRLGQIFQALPSSDAAALEKPIEDWLSASLENWWEGPRDGGRVSLFIVHLLLTSRLSVSERLRRRVARVAAGSAAFQLTAHAYGWPDFDPVELSLALCLLSQGDITPRLAEAASQALDEASEPSMIWRSRPTLNWGDEYTAGCSSFYACRALIRAGVFAHAASAMQRFCLRHVAWLLDRRSVSPAWFHADLQSDRGVPATWFNCLVLSFLSEVRGLLREQLRLQVLTKYRARSIASAIDWKKLALSNDVRAALERDFISRKGESNPRLEKSTAILFGPPGTAKTSIAESLSLEMGWQFVELGVADFLADGLDRVFARAITIFEDLNKLDRVVILLDEVEGVFADRKGDGRDLRQQFLTSALLPPLKRIRDRKAAILLIATNHLDQFDAAVSRSGRIDLILGIGPPVREQRATIMVDVLKITSAVAADVAARMRDGTTIGEILRIKQIQDYADLDSDGLEQEWLALGGTKNEISEDALREFNEHCEKSQRY